MQIHAGGPGKKDSGKGNAAIYGKTVRDEVAIAGLEKAHVHQFEVLEFLRSKVVSYPLYLRRILTEDDGQIDVLRD